MFCVMMRLRRSLAFWTFLFKMLELVASLYRLPPAMISLYSNFTFFFYRNSSSRFHLPISGFGFLTVPSLSFWGGGLFISVFWVFKRGNNCSAPVLWIQIIFSWIKFPFLSWCLFLLISLYSSSVILKKHVCPLILSSYQFVSVWT